MKNEILIVEDDEIAPVALMRLLGMRGYRVDLARDAVMAMTHAVRRHPALVILDMGLPAGGGYAVLEQMRANPVTCAIPVVVLTGDRTIAESDAIAAGANAFFVKSDALEPLLAAVERWVPIAQQFSRLPPVGNAILPS
jgi:CheY-like chemotaxis protein